MPPPRRAQDLDLPRVRSAEDHSPHQTGSIRRRARAGRALRGEPHKPSLRLVLTPEHRPSSPAAGRKPLEHTVCGGRPVYYRRLRAQGRSSAGAATMIFLHNAGTDHCIWSPMADLLSREADCVQLNLPGYGAPRGEPHGHSLGDYARTLSEFIRAHDLASVVLVGNCLGSGVALEYCRRQRGRGIEAMVLFHVLAPRTLGVAGRLLLGWSRSALKPLYRAALRVLRTPRSLAAFAVKQQVKDRGRVPDPTWDHLVELSGEPENARNVATMVGSLDECSHLDSLRMPEGFPPTMVIWGDGNAILPLERGRSFAHSVGATALVVEDGGHLVMLERPERCAEHMRRFLRSHRAAEAHDSPPG